MNSSASARATVTTEPQNHKPTLKSKSTKVIVESEEETEESEVSELSSDEASSASSQEEPAGRSRGRAQAVKQRK